MGKIKYYITVELHSFGHMDVLSLCFACGSGFVALGNFTKLNALQIVIYRISKMCEKIEIKDFLEPCVTWSYSY